MAKKPLSRIPESALERSIRLLSFGVRSGLAAATKARTAVQHAEELARVLGEMKGSVMKVGQMLGMVGEHFFPPEVNAVLRTLNAHSAPIAWETMRDTLVQRLGEERVAELDINPHPLAAASLGQVHWAKIKSTSQAICLKIQYPGVARAIEGDLRNLRMLLKMMGALPANFNEEPIFDEVQDMLRREVDYVQEKDATRTYQHLLADDLRYIVPDVFDAYSTDSVLATTWIDSYEIESPEVRTLSQERRNQLALNYLELYLFEFYRWGLVQTDPHFGNYRVRLADDQGTGQHGTNAQNQHPGDQLVLLDFGAVRRFDRTFVHKYARMVNAAINRDTSATRDAAVAVNMLPTHASPAMADAFCQLIFTITEPFQGGVYDWGQSDLPKRAQKLGMQLIFEQKMPTPPQEVLFLDRKLGGIFVFLSHLRARIDARPLFDKALAACFTQPTE